MKDKITVEELETWGHSMQRLADILNKDYPLDKAIEDIKSFRNTEYYTGNNPKFIKTDDWKPNDC